MPPLENISHARTKYPFTNTGESSFFIPSQRFGPVHFAKESARSCGAPKLVSHSLRPQFRIAVIASRRNLLATPPRVECVVRPLNMGVLCHYERIVASRPIR